MAAMDDEIDRAAAVVLSRSTASAVPSPTRFPNETAAPSTGGSMSRSNSEASSIRRSVSDFSICPGESMGYLLHRSFVNNTSTGKISRRPTIINPDNNHFARIGRLA